MIAFSDKNLSVGTMEIKPNKELAKHSRPVWESLYQIKGKCIIKLFKKDGLTKEIILNDVNRSILSINKIFRVETI